MKYSAILTLTLLFVTAATTLAKHSAGKKNQGGKGKGGTKNKNNKNKNKHQLGSKSSKDGSKPSKGGGGGGGKKRNFDECVFANPILRQTGVEDVGIADISHAEAVNYVFEDAVTSWMMDNVTAWELAEITSDSANAWHPALFENLSDSVKTSAICNMAHTLIEQMEDTCYYDKMLKTYANVAANMMAGFSWSIYDEVDILECEGDDGSMFGDEYGHVLTEETMEVLAY